MRHLRYYSHPLPGTSSEAMPGPLPSMPTDLLSMAMPPDLLSMAMPPDLLSIAIPHDHLSMARPGPSPSVPSELLSMAMPSPLPSMPSDLLSMAMPGPLPSMPPDLLSMAMPDPVPSGPLDLLSMAMTAAAGLEQVELNSREEEPLSPILARALAAYSMEEDAEYDSDSGSEGGEGKENVPDADFGNMSLAEKTGRGRGRAGKRVRTSPVVYGRGPKVEQNKVLRGRLKGLQANLEGHKKKVRARKARKVKEDSDADEAPEDPGEPTTVDPGSSPETMPEKPFPCQTCGKGFGAKRTLKMHMKIHRDYPEGLKCRTCQKVLRSAASLVHHERAHTEETPFACPSCDKAFTTKLAYSRHYLKSHSGESSLWPYACPACPASYTTKGSLARHQRKFGHSEAEGGPESGTTADGVQWQLLHPPPILEVQEAPES